MNITEAKFRSAPQGSKPRESWMVKQGGGFDHYKFDANVQYRPRGTTYTLPTNPDHWMENPFDLRNLRFIDPQAVVKTTEQLVANFDPNKNAAIFIGTGGTIASQKGDKGGFPRLDV